MIDNIDINTLIVDAILVDNENQAEFILKKLNEDVVEQMLPMFEKEVYVALPNDLIEGEED